MSENIEYYRKIPSKSFFSYILLFLPYLSFIPICRNLIVKFGMKNCKKIHFEPGFRFYYGYNIHSDNVYFGNTLVMDYAPVYVGHGTAFSKDNKLITASHDYLDRNKIIAKPIHIGKNVWISTNCIILGGVSIGDNCIIGAGSVVTKNIPKNCIAAGNPCRIIKQCDENVKVKGFYG